MQNEILNNFIFRQREAQFQIRKKFNVEWIDIEVLAYSQKNVFFTRSNLHHFYPHTNFQLLYDSLKKLEELKLIKNFSGGVKKNPTKYVVLPAGKKVLKHYIAVITDEIKNQSPGN